MLSPEHDKAWRRAGGAPLEQANSEGAGSQANPKEGGLVARADQDSYLGKWRTQQESGRAEQPAEAEKDGAELIPEFTTERLDTEIWRGIQPANSKGSTSVDRAEPAAKSGPLEPRKRPKLPEMPVQEAGPSDRADWEGGRQCKGDLQPRTVPSPHFEDRRVPAE